MSIKRTWSTHSPGICKHPLCAGHQSGQVAVMEIDEVSLLMRAHSWETDKLTSKQFWVMVRCTNVLFV